MDFGALEGNGNVSHLILLDRCGGWCCKKRHCHPHLKQWLLSIEMKTKVAQHVEREWLNEWESEWMSERERVLLVPSFCMTFRHLHLLWPVRNISILYCGKSNLEVSHLLGSNLFWKVSFTSTSTISTIKNCRPSRHKGTCQKFW